MRPACQTGAIWPTKTAEHPLTAASILFFNGCQVGNKFLFVWLGGVLKFVWHNLLLIRGRCRRYRESGRGMETRRAFIPRMSRAFPQLSRLNHKQVSISSISRQYKSRDYIYMVAIVTNRRTRASPLLWIACINFCQHLNHYIEV